MKRFDSNKEWVVERESGMASFNTLLYKSTVPISSIFLKASLIKKNGGFSESEKVGTSEDYEFVLRYALSTDFYYIDEFLIKYWSGENRTTCLDFGINVKAAFIHLKTIINIYCMVYKISETSIFEYLKPAFFNIKNSMKVMLYIIMQRLRLR